MATRGCKEAVTVGWLCSVPAVAPANACGLSLLMAISSTASTAILAMVQVPRTEQIYKDRYGAVLMVLIGQLGTETTRTNAAIRGNEVQREARGSTRLSQ
jgi:hypothetical protein